MIKLNDARYSTVQVSFLNFWGVFCVYSLLGKYKITVDGKVIQKVICGFDVTLDSTRLLVASAGKMRYVFYPALALDVLCDHLSMMSYAEGIFIFDVETKEQLEHIQLNSVCRAVRWNTKPGHQVRVFATCAQSNDMFCCFDAFLEPLCSYS